MMKIKVKYIPNNQSYQMVRLDDGKTLMNLEGRNLPF